MLLMMCFISGCNTYEIDGVNKLIEAGNTAINEANKFWQEAKSKNDNMFNSVNTDEYLEKRDSFKSTAQQAVDGFEKSAEKYREASAKFDQASKLKIHEKLKEYLTAKSQEFAKRAEQADIAKGTTRAFMESSDAVTLSKTTGENKERIEKLEKEINELAEKSSRIQQDNKNIFMPDSK